MCGPQGYIRSEIGGSFSRCADVKVARSDWTVTREGYNNDLHKTVIFGAGMGLHVNSMLSLGLSGHYRSLFKYRQPQTIDRSAYSTPLNNDNLFFPSLNNFKRSFDLDNASFMFDVYINRAGQFSCYQWCVCGCSLIPYAGVSVGLSKNMVSNFHTETDRDNIAGSEGNAFEFKGSRTIMTYKGFNHVGWSAQLGFDVSVKDAMLIGIGYRYFDGGEFCTNNYTIDPLRGTQSVQIDDTDTSISNLERTYTYALKPWHMKLRCHELVGSLSFSF
jgi:opacity protein-like surface antigen